MGSSSQTRDRTQGPCIGSRSLSHWTTREVPRVQNLLASSHSGERKIWTGSVQVGLVERCDIAQEARRGEHEGKGLCGDRLWKERVYSVSGKTGSERFDVLSWEPWFHVG